MSSTTVSFLLQPQVSCSSSNCISHVPLRPERTGVLRSTSSSPHVEALLPPADAGPGGESCLSDVPMARVLVPPDGAL